MGKGSNVSKANKAREKNMAKKAGEGRGGGGKDGIEKRNGNAAERMQAAADERKALVANRAAEKIKKEKDAKVAANKLSKKGGGSAPKSFLDAY